MERPLSSGRTVRGGGRPFALPTAHQPETTDESGRFDDESL